MGPTLTWRSRLRALQLSWGASSIFIDITLTQILETTNDCSRLWLPKCFCNLPLNGTKTQSDYAEIKMKCEVFVRNILVSSHRTWQRRKFLFALLRFAAPGNCRLFHRNVLSRFNDLSYKTSRSPESVVDIFRFIKLCYYLLCPGEVSSLHFHWMRIINVRVDRLTKS